MKINNLNDFITPGKAFSKIPDIADMSSYESPIKMYVSQMVKQVEEARENEILHTIREEYAIDVDKEELIKALNYDRGQYDKGFREGYNKGMEAAQSIIDKFVGYLDEDMIYRIKLAIDKKLNSQ